MSHDKGRNADRSTRSTKLDHIRRAGLGLGAYIVGIVAATALVGALSAPTAQAASQYDNAIQVYNPLLVNRIGAGDDDYRDYSIDWYNEALLATEIRCNQFGDQRCTIEADLRWLLESDISNWAVVPLFNSGSDPTAYGFKIVYSFNLSAKVELLLEPPDFSYASVTDGTFYATAEFNYQPSSPYATENGTVLNGVGDDYDSGISYSDGTRRIFLSTYPVTYPLDYEGSPIPDNAPDPSLFDQWEHDPENMPITENEDCDWWDFSCWSGTVDFNPLRDAAEEAAGNFGFIAQLGGIFSKIVETLTVMPSVTNLPGYDPCGNPAAGWCKVDLEILDGYGLIDFHKWRNNSMMEVLQPWLLLITMGGMAWMIFKSVVGIIERVTSA